MPTALRYCGMCDKWFKQRTVECKLCGADTERMPTTTRDDRPTKETPRADHQID